MAAELDSAACAPVSVPTVKELKALAFELNESIKNAKIAPEGFAKLKRKVMKELQHLQTLDDSLNFNSSNIYYLQCIWQTILAEGNSVRHVFKKFKYLAHSVHDANDPLLNLSSNNAQSTDPPNISYAQYNSVPRKHLTADGKHKKAELIVDIVCDDGLRWIKVKTCNPYSMQIQFINSGSSSKGKNIVSMADNFIAAAKQHQVYFQAPKIEFVFSEGITSDLAYILRKKSISIRGREIKEDFLYEQDYEDDDEEEEVEDEAEIVVFENDAEQEDEMELKEEHDESHSPELLDESSVNLGVRTMLTMLSALANNEIDECFFDELQDSLLEKQMDIVNDMFSHNNEPNDQQSEITDKDHKSKQRKKAATKTSVVNLDFEYCDGPETDAKDNADDEEVYVNAAKNRFTSSGYTIGHQQRLRISRAARRKRFSEKSYEEQKMLLQCYLDERQCAVLPQIMKCIENKRLVCCESAWNHFMDIVNLSAGPNELKRCKQLQERICIVADSISERTQQLKGKSMSHINKCVFGTGDSLKIMTITAIASFVRKAEQQGVKYFVHVHSVRPLTERYQRAYQTKKRENNHIEDGQQLIEEIEQNEDGGEEEEQQIIVEEDELTEHEKEDYLIVD